MSNQFWMDRVKNLSLFFRNNSLYRLRVMRGTQSQLISSFDRAMLSVWPVLFLL